MPKCVLHFLNLVFAAGGILFIVGGSIIFVDTAKYDISGITQIVSTKIVLVSPIVIGCALFIVAFLGCFGTIRESSGCIITYAISLASLMISKLGLVICLWLQVDNIINVCNTIDCTAESVKFLYTHDTIIKYSGLGLAAIECVGLVFACCLHRDIYNKSRRGEKIVATSHCQYSNTY